MLLRPNTQESWRLLTPKNISVGRLWPWGQSVQKILAGSEPAPRECGRLLIASDYSGNHSKSTHLVYCYLLVKSTTGEWLSDARSARLKHLRDGRGLSYKNLNDAIRQKALIPFLQAAAHLDGHLVAFAVDKRKKWLSSVPGAADILSEGLQLKARWNPRSLEAMIRKVHFVAILLSIWSRPYADVTWITDDDEFVANDLRHDDALQSVARMSSFYLDHPMGAFRLNTTKQDPEDHEFEDICAIPDLAAGMLSEISTALNAVACWGGRMQKMLDGDLPTKAEVIADWFWDVDMPLRKTLISIDVEGDGFSVRKVWMQSGIDIPGLL